MTPVKIIALVFILFALVKLLVIAINPKSWKGVVKKFYAKPLYITVIALILGVVILRSLLQELTIVQIFASMTFMMVLMMVQFAAYGKEITEISDKFLNNRNILKKIWLSLSIWLILMIWVLVDIFA
ncbi:hypothetical protein ACFL1E_03720 [Candidatus Omnitrophota bacterium]